MAIEKLKFLKLVLLHSFTAFGGPQSHLAMMLKTFVTQNKFITETELLEYNAFCQLLPGASSTQTLTLIGYKLGGVPMAIITLLIWILPASFLMGGFSFLLAYIDKNSIETGWFQFLPALAVGFLIYACILSFPIAIKNKICWIILFLTLLLTLLFFRNPVIFPVVIVVGGIVSNLFLRDKKIVRVKRQKINWWSFGLFLFIFLVMGIISDTARKQDWIKRKPVNLFENTYRMGSLVFGGGQVLMPMMYEQFCVRPVAVQKKNPNAIKIAPEDMYSAMGIVRAMPGPVFSIAAFTGGMALKDYGGQMQLLGCIIGMVAIFLPSVLLVLFFFPIWNNLKKYPVVYRSLEGINAATVGILIASTLYILKDISLLEANTISVWNIVIMAGVFSLLRFTKIPPPYIVIACLLLGHFT